MGLPVSQLARPSACRPRAPDNRALVAPLSSRSARRRSPRASAPKRTGTRSPSSVRTSQRPDSSSRWRAETGTALCCG